MVKLYAASIGIVIIAGVGINSNNIASMEPFFNGFKYDNEKCLVKFDSGNAWSGQYRVLIPASCEKVLEQINLTKQEKDQP